LDEQLVGCFAVKETAMSLVLKFLVNMWIRPPVWVSHTVAVLMRAEKNGAIAAGTCDPCDRVWAF
jgi:hypothetical protein